jgi:hypothetical protein
MTTQTISIGPSNFDASNSLGVAGSCVTNKTVTVWGAQVVLPFSDICPYLAHLGTVLVFVAWIGAAVIVGKGVTA